MSPSRDEVSSLPPSVEEAYRRKCIQLKARMREVEDANDQYRLRRERLARGIRKMRFERAILLETLAKRMNKKGPKVLEGEWDGDTSDSTDAPPTPQERPMRIKRPHRRPDPFVHEGTPGRPGGGMNDGRMDESTQGELAEGPEGPEGGEGGMDPYAAHRDAADDDTVMDAERLGDSTVTNTIERPSGAGQHSQYQSGSHERGVSGEAGDDGDESMMQD